MEFKNHKNLVSAFQEQVTKYKSRTALLYKDLSEKSYCEISWSEFGERVKHLSYALESLGVNKGDRVAILSENRPEWAITDIATLSLGAIDVPIYPTSSIDDTHYILNNCEAKILFLSSQEHYQRLATSLKTLECLKAVVLFDGDSADPDIMFYSNLLDLGKEECEKNVGVFQEWIDRVEADDIATLIYTSGTTGSPKGVMLSHRNFLSNIEGSSHHIKVSETDISLSFLPLSHVFERMAGYYFMLFHGAKIAYAESMKTVPEDILTVKPTVAASVPRLYEKIHAGIYEKLKLQSAKVQKLFHWAIQTGNQKAGKELAGERVSLILKIKFRIADKLVFSKIREKLGGRLRFFISGGAPLSAELGKFFYSANILILEGYGLTETSPVIAVNAPENVQFGTVGKPLPNVEVMIASDGEILTRSDSVMRGYYQNEEATREVIDSEGWFHTGDIGILTDQGLLKITDRKKDIIVTSGGKNISPQNIENRILGDTLFTQIVVIGDKRNYLVALIVPNKTELLSQLVEYPELCNLSWNELLTKDKVYEIVASRLEAKIADLPSYERIKYFDLLPDELSQEKGELTPTLKIKRKVIMQNYADRINKLYVEGSQFHH